MSEKLTFFDDLCGWLVKVVSITFISAGCTFKMAVWFLDYDLGLFLPDVTNFDYLTIVFWTSTTCIFIIILGLILYYRPTVKTDDKTESNIGDETDNYNENDNNLSLLEGDTVLDMTQPLEPEIIWEPIENRDPDSFQKLNFSLWNIMNLIESNKKF
ncbi:hypothetical protein BLOT_008607 [Blomia tropicalis]|nr:hypothetical protein BLOT_008607 [Blomia tropicalis]